jgi:hypothetical protein
MNEGHTPLKVVEPVSPRGDRAWSQPSSTGDASPTPRTFPDGIRVATTLVGPPGEFE